jgi:CheY-like chemotaxis protein
MFCDMFQKLSATCKAGRKSGECPQKRAKKKKTDAKEGAFDAKALIGIDLPFNYEEVISVTGPEYVKNLNRDGMSFVPYEELKKRIAEQIQVGGRPAAVYPEYPEEPVYKNILVVDDEAAVNNNIRKILLKKEYHVDQAFTKSQALEKIEKRSYKLILLDLRIPGVRALELLEAIRAKHPKTKVIIITGYATIETAKETARLGAIDYLAKPFTPDEIRTATEKAFRYAA